MHKSSQSVSGIDPGVLSLMRALHWIPQDWQQLWHELFLLPDFQRGWFISLYIGCATSPIPGYLKSHDLWKLVGCRSETSFKGRSAAVLSAFQVAEIDGEQYLYHPRLLAVIIEQLGKLKKRRSSTVSELSTSGGQLPLHLFSVLKGKKELPGKSVSGSVPGSEEFRERIAERLAELRNQGKRAR